MATTQFDVVLLGEPLVEVSTTEAFRHGADGVLGVSGDVVNAGAAAAAAGASVALVARVSDDELGDAVCRRIRELGIDDTFVRRVPGQQGVYFLHIDPEGNRQFSYARAGSVGSQLDVADLPVGVIENAGAVLGGGIAAALSPTLARTMLHVAQHSGRFVYDPNFRPRLTTADQARDFLQNIAAYCEVMVPSAPSEIELLLGTDDPASAAASLMGWGARSVVVTQGSEGSSIFTEEGRSHQPVIPARQVIDQTGAGDVFAGTLTARLALGDDLREAAAMAAAAASLSVGGRGGTGLIAPLDEIRRHGERYRTERVAT
ncbi:2-keto-3-deoxygluconate kinase [Rhodococcus sp. 14-2483-1-1]|uniref:PfkB family carbohydrate kinase n=1 Tax=Rhodococcus sp. 14-2483-1-1 TaxID=2023148 RepID=UPI000B9BB68B|nr:PfkB family carbohydrate kinase [Rhodococcus sp. 14-2483-1-1]OZF39215.1 2-keto-3-deoxygluconate kinase [Rhodococcus sp. 14-2483-1-1]